MRPRPQGTDRPVRPAPALRRPWVSLALLALALAAALPALAILAAPSADDVVPPPDDRTGASAQLAPPYAHAWTWTPPPFDTRPLDVALAEGTLLVADGTRHQVHAYDDAGRRVGFWGAPPAIAPSGHEAFVLPTHLAVDGANRIAYVLWQRWTWPVLVGAAPNAAWIERRAIGAEEPTGVAPLALDDVRATAWDAERGRLLVAAGRRLQAVDPATGLPTPLPVTFPASDRVDVAASGERLAVVTHGGTPARAVLHALDGTVASVLEPPAAPVAVTSGPDGGFGLLLAPPDRADAAAPLLASFDASGALGEVLTVGSLDVPGPLDAAWPWAVASDGSRVALTTALADAAAAAPVHAVAWGERGGALRTVPFGPFDRAFKPASPTMGGPGGAPGVDASASGIAVLNCSGTRDPLAVGGDCGRSGSRAFVLEPGGVLGGGRPLPPEAVDVAMDGAGRLLVGTADLRERAADDGPATVTAPSAVHRLGPVHAAQPVWSAACDCPIGGRLAAGTGVLYVAKPERRAVAALDPGTGTSVGQALPDAPHGLWPSDVAVGAGGRLFAADTSGGRVLRFDGPGQASAIWPGGPVGPLRIAVGPWQDGRQVVAALLADGRLALLDAADGELLARWGPALPDGTPIDASDAAIGPDGTLYLADRRGAAVHAFRPEDGPVGPPEEPAPTPTPSRYTCAVRGDKTAGPRRVVLGATVGVTLSLHADCPARDDAIGADIVFAMRSFHHGGTLTPFVVSTVRDLLTRIDASRHRVGAVVDASRASDEPHVVPLAADPVPVLELLDLRFTEYGRLRRAIVAATDLLAADARPEALQVLVLMVDLGRQGEPLVEAMAAARAAGIVTFVVSERRDPELADVAGSPERYLVDPSPAQLYGLVAQVLRIAGISMAGNLTIDDAMAPDIDYLPGSARPAALERDARLSWGRSLLPATGLTMTYTVRPTRLGVLPVNEVAVARFTDFDGAERELVYPVPEIEVVLPTATPTPSATPTPEPVALFLPIALRAQCLATSGHVDVVLLVDASLSMAGESMAAARRAAKAFVGELDPERDQAAVIGFNAAPRVAVGLSRDRAALAAAIDGLQPAAGTRMDLALREAIDLLQVSPSRRPDNRPVVILLTDGVHEGSGEDVVREAERGRRQGMRLYAIRLGTAASEALLRRVADRDGYHEAPGPADLERIYRAIAGEVPCL